MTDSRWLADWDTFIKIVDSGSMAAAAQRLGCSRAQVSKRLAELESALGTRLLERTTRSLHLTPSGEVFYPHALRVLAEVNTTERALQHLRTEPHGILRITAPVTFGRLHIAPLLAGLSRNYPDMHCELVLQDRLVMVAEEGFDVAIRLTDAPPQEVVAKPLATIQRMICASPAYLERQGVPQQPADLKQHACFAYAHARTQSEWHLQGPQGVEVVPVRGHYQVNHIEVILAAVLNGDGMAILPDYVCHRELARGHVVPVLPGYTPITRFGRHVYACYPASRVQLPKLRVFLAALTQQFQPQPPWAAGVPLAGAG